MDIRYSASPRDVKRYTTEELRKEFLITDMYAPDEVRATYSHVDRMVIMGIMPVNEEVPIDKGIDVWANFGTNFFLERRDVHHGKTRVPAVVERELDLLGEAGRLISVNRIHDYGNSRSNEKQQLFHHCIPFTRLKQNYLLNSTMLII